MRHPVLRRKMRRDMSRHSAQFVAVAITIFLGIMLFGATFDAYRSLEASYEEMYERTSFADLWVEGGDTQAFAEHARSTEGVEAVTTRTEVDVPMRFGDEGLVGRVTTLPADGAPEVNDVLLLEGELPAGDDEVALERHAADHFDVGLGDRFVVGTGDDTIEVTVSSVTASPEYIWPARSRQDIFPAPDDFAVAYARPALGQRIAELPGASTVEQAVVTYAGSVPAAQLDEKLRSTATSMGAADSYPRAEQPSNFALQSDVKGFGDMAFMFPVLFLTAAGLGTWVILTRVVMSQRQVIGMLGANGVPRRTIFGHYASYGVLMGVGAAVLGVIAGAVAANSIAELYTSAIDVPITVVKVDLLSPTIGLTFGLGAGFLAAAAPALRATRLEPAEAMRGVAPTGRGGPTPIERVFPPVRRLGTPVLLVLRSVFRNPRRTATTMVGVVLALVLIITSWGMIDTVTILLDRQFDTIENQDAEVLAPGGVDEQLVEDVRSTDGVAASEVIGQVPVGLGQGENRYGTALVAFERDTSFHTFIAPDGGEIELPGDGVVLGEALRGILDVDVGDRVPLQVPALGASLDVSVAGFVDEPLGTFAYASMDAVRAALPDVPDQFRNTVYVRYEPGVDRDVMEDRLAALPGVAAVTDAKALEQLVNDFLGLFYAFVGVMLLFGGMLAFALVFNAMSVNIAERTVEAATLEATGVRSRTVGRLITAENLVVTAVALVPGVLVAIWSAGLFMSTYDSDQFSFTLELRWWTPMGAALGIIVVALLSQRPGLRAISRLDVAEVVRSRAT